MSKKTTDAADIRLLKGAERVRKRPAAILGSDGLDGCEHAFFEILSNSVDEAREGRGSLIEVTVFTDHTMIVDDHGRGVPLGFNENEGRYNWDLIYCELYAGNKYDNNADDAAYKFSLGTNGLGACATQYTSEHFEVKSYDGDNEYSMSFVKGEPIGELRTRSLDKKERRTGTCTKWKPDLEVFTDINIPRDFYEDVLQRQSVVNAGVRFTFSYQLEDGSFDRKEFYYENGIKDYLLELAGDHVVTDPVSWHLETKGRDREDKAEYRLVGDVCWFAVTSGEGVLQYYHNSSFLEHGGSTERAVRTAFTWALDRRLKAQGKYKKNEKPITFDDIEDCVMLIVNTFSSEASYENQTKKAVNNTFIKDALTAFLKEQLEIFFLENPAAGDKLVGQVLINKRARESADATRLNIKKSLTASAGDLSSRVEKFVSCRSKDASRREVYIVEGDSAMTSCKLGRNAEFQAIIPVRGKTLNCLKSSYDKIFKSDIITDLLRVIGCGVELSGKIKGNIPLFDINQLRWSKIIICTDADEDGFQIRTLLLTLFYRLLPTLIEKGYVYIAESPLYEITTKDEILFAYNEPEKNDIIDSLAGTKYTLQRSKGLGENEPEMMWKTTMNPATRRLIRVSPTDAAATAVMFDTLLGDDLPARKEFIAKYGCLYSSEADI